ncbi:MAG: acetate--CoA ligase, partial [Gaiellales bacterium]
MSDAIEAHMDETRRVAPPAEFAKHARVHDRSLHDEAEADFTGFWMKRALEEITWTKEPTVSLNDANPPFYKWFEDGELNLTYNCLDRHVEAGGGDKVAYTWIGEPGEERVITYRELLADVERAANALKDLGVGKGDRVAIYLGMVPELPISMLACARIGAIHSVVFGGFAASALADRIQDATCKLVITGDGAWRRGQIIPLKDIADEAVAMSPSIEHVLVVRRTEQDVAWTDKDIWWHDALAAAAPNCPPEPMNAEDVLFMLYTSGTTAKPKGIVHTSGGYLLGAILSHQWVFDIKPDDVYWCTADCGWVTGHTYVVYGPLANHTTGIIYEGTPEHPTWERHWEIVHKHKVTIYYTAPTAIRALIKAGPEAVAKYDVSSLRLLGTVGEPINPEAWVWYHEHVGGERCPIVDTWWQTETGSIVLSPLPGLSTTKPGSAIGPLPGMKPVIVDEQGAEVAIGGGGYLTLQRPWPSMLRTIWGDDQRFIDTYWNRFGKTVYFTGDGARTDADGDIWLLGRVDDVINVAGHRISTTEIESSLVGHPAVAEAAATGAEDPIKGEMIAAFVILRDGVDQSEELRAELAAHVAGDIGKFARPSLLLFAPDLPKTRSGKIMRRLLKNIAEGK